MVFLLGCGALAREVAMLFEGPWAFVDPHATEDRWNGITIYRSLEQAIEKNGPRACLPAIAEPRAKGKLLDEMKSAGLPLAASLIHARAYIHPTASIADGCVIYPAACISHSVVLEVCVHVLFSCSVGHDVRLGTCVTLSPAVAISGHVKVGAETFFGTNSSVFERLTIGERCRLSMGSILTEDLPARTNAMTNPRLMKLPIEDKEEK